MIYYIIFKVGEIFTKKENAGEIFINYITEKYGKIENYNFLKGNFYDVNEKYYLYNYIFLLRTWINLMKKIKYYWFLYFWIQEFLKKHN